MFIIIPGKREKKSPMFWTRALSSWWVCPEKSTHSISVIASSTLSSERRRMPLSTPETVETIVMPTASAIRAICTAIEFGIPNRAESP